MADNNESLLDCRDLRSFMNSTGRSVTLSEARQLVEQYDSDGDGKLTFQQVMKALRSSEKKRSVKSSNISRKSSSPVKRKLLSKQISEPAFSAFAALHPTYAAATEVSVALETFSDRVVEAERLIEARLDNQISLPAVVAEIKQHFTNVILDTAAKARPLLRMTLDEVFSPGLSQFSPDDVESMGELQGKLSKVLRSCSRGIDSIHAVKRDDRISIQGFHTVCAVLTDRVAPSGILGSSISNEAAGEAISKSTIAPENGSPVEYKDADIVVMAVSSGLKTKGRLEVSLSIKKGVLKRRSVLRFTNQETGTTVDGVVEAIKSSSIVRRNLPVGNTGDTVLVVLKNVASSMIQPIKKRDMGVSVNSNDESPRGRKKNQRNKDRKSIMNANGRGRGRRRKKAKSRSPERNIISPIPTQTTHKTSLSPNRRKKPSTWEELETEIATLLRTPNGLDDMWAEMDYNGDGKVSLAETDFLLSQQYAKLDNAAALIVAYRIICPDRTDIDGEKAFVKREEFTPLMRSIFFVNRMWDLVRDPEATEDEKAFSPNELKMVLKRLNLMAHCSGKGALTNLYKKLRGSFEELVRWVERRRMRLRSLGEHQILPPSGKVDKTIIDSDEVQREISMIRESVGENADTAATEVQAVFRGRMGRRRATEERSARSLQAVARGRNARKDVSRRRARNRKRIEEARRKEEEERSRKELRSRLRREKLQRQEEEEKSRKELRSRLRREKLQRQEEEEKSRRELQRNQMKKEQLKQVESMERAEAIAKQKKRANNRREQQLKLKEQQLRRKNLRRNQNVSRHSTANTIRKQKFSGDDRHAVKLQAVARGRQGRRRASEVQNIRKKEWEGAAKMQAIFRGRNVRQNFGALKKGVVECTVMKDSGMPRSGKLNLHVRVLKGVLRSSVKTKLIFSPSGVIAVTGNMTTVPRKDPYSGKLSAAKNVELVSVGESAILEIQGVEAMDEISMGNIGYSTLTDKQRNEIRSQEAKDLTIGKDGLSKRDRQRMLRAVLRLQSNYRAVKTRQRVMMGLMPRKTGIYDLSRIPKSGSSSTWEDAAKTVQKHWRGYSVRCKQLNVVNQELYSKMVLRFIFYQMTSLRKNRTDPMEMLVRIQSGICKTGTNIIFQPSGVSGTIASIYKTLPPKSNNLVPEKGEKKGDAKPGELVLISVNKVLSSNVYLKSGDIGGSASSPPQPVCRFMAQILIKMGSIKVGDQITVTSHHKRIVCEVEGFVYRQDVIIEGGQPKNLHTRHGVEGQVVMLILVPCRSAVLERYPTCPPMGQLSITPYDSNPFSLNSSLLSKKRRKVTVGGLEAYGTVIDVQRINDPLPAWAKPFKDNLKKSIARREKVAKAMLRIADVELKHQQLQAEQTLVASRFSIIVNVKPGAMGVQLTPTFLESGIGACVMGFPNPNTSQLAQAGVRKGMILQMIEMINVEEMQFTDIMLLLRARSKLSNKLTFLTEDGEQYLETIRSTKKDTVFTITVNIDATMPLGAVFKANDNRGYGAVIASLLREDGCKGQLEESGIGKDMWVISVDNQDCEEMPFEDARELLVSTSGRRQKTIVFGTNDPDAAKLTANRKIKVQKQVDTRKEAIADATARRRRKENKMNITVNLPPNAVLGAKFESVQIKRSGEIGACILEFHDGPRDKKSLLKSKGARIGMILQSINGENVLQYSLHSIQKQLRESSKSRMTLVFGASEREKKAVAAAKSRSDERKTRSRKKRVRNASNEAEIGHSVRLIIVKATNLPVAMDGFIDPKDGTQTTFCQIVLGEVGESWMEKIAEARQEEGRMCEIGKKQNKRNPTWNSSQWLDSFGLENPEATIRVINWASGNRTKIVGEVKIALPFQRSSKGLLSLPLEDIYGSKNEKLGSLSFMWERALAIDVDPNRIPGQLPPTRFVEVELKPGPLGCRLQPGFMGIGVRLTAFLLVRGKKGPLEKSEVDPGMYLIELNGTDISSHTFDEVRQHLKNCSQKRRTLVFSTRPSDSCLVKGVAKILELDDQRAARRIQRCYRLKKEEGFFEESRRKLRRYEREKRRRNEVRVRKKRAGLAASTEVLTEEERKMLGLEAPHFRIGIIGGTQLAQGRTSKTGARQKSRSSYVEIVVGTLGTFEDKVQYAKRYPKLKLLKRTPLTSNNNGFPIWNKALWFQPETSIGDSSASCRIIDVADNTGEESVVGEFTFRLGPKRKSDGVIKMPVRDRESQIAGYVSLLWEATAVGKIEKQRAPKITDPYESITVDVGKGVLGCQLVPGFGGLGSRIGAFMLVNGAEGQIERAGVKFGWYMESLNGDDSIGMMEIDKILDLIKKMRKKTKKIKFASRPTEKCLKFASMRAFALAPDRAAGRIQRVCRNYVRKRREGRTINNRLEAKLENERREIEDMSKAEWQRGIERGEVQMGNDVKVTIIGGGFLPAGKRFRERRYIYVEVLVGESGRNWAMKQKALSMLQATVQGKRLRRYYRLGGVRPNMIKKSSNPVWGENNSAWLRVDHLSNPEITIRVMDDMGIKNDGTPMDPVVVAVGQLRIPPNTRASNDVEKVELRVSGGQQHDDAVAYVKWERSVDTSRRSQDVTKDGSPEYKIELRMKPGPLSARFVEGFDGLGLRVASFVLGSDGKPGPLEKAGVRLGMYLRELNDNSDIGEMDHGDIITLLEKTQWSRKRYMMWSTRPSDTGIKYAITKIFGNKEKQHRAINLIKRKLREKVERKRNEKLLDPEARKEMEKWKLKEEERKEMALRASNEVAVTIVQGHDIPLTGIGGVASSTLFFQALAGERGSSWTQKMKFIDENFQRLRSELKENDRDYNPREKTQEVKKSKNPAWGEQMILSIDGLKKPEIMLRLVEKPLRGGVNTWSERPPSKQLKVIGDVTLFLPANARHEEVDKNGSIMKKYELGNDQSFVTLSWERLREVDLKNENIKKIQNRENKVIKVKVPPGPLGVRLEEGFLHSGARIKAFTMVNGRIGAIEKAGVQPGMYLVGMNKISSIGTILFKDVNRLIHHFRNTERIFTFQSRPSRDAVMEGIAQSLGMTRSRAEGMVKKALRRKVASNRMKYDGVRIWIDVPPGPLCTKLHASATKMGVYVSGFVPNSDGRPGLLEKKGVKVGMYLRSINNRDVSTWRFEMITVLLRKLSKQNKVISFASKPGRKALSRGASSAFKAKFEEEKKGQGAWAKNYFPSISEADPEKNPLSAVNVARRAKKKKEKREARREARERLEHPTKKKINKEKKQSKEEKKEQIIDVKKLPESEKEYWVVAKFDYDAQEEEELSFHKGDRIRIINRDDDNWWMGELSGVCGEFSRNYVTQPKPERKVPIPPRLPAFNRDKRETAYKWVVRLKPGEYSKARFDIPSNSNGIGVQIASFPPVLDDNFDPLQMAGLRSGLRLVAINNIDVSGLLFCQIRMLQFRYRYKLRTLTFSSRLPEYALEVRSSAAHASHGTRFSLENARTKYDQSASTFRSRRRSGERVSWPEQVATTVKVALRGGSVGARLGKGRNGVGTCLIEYVRPKSGPLKGRPMQLEATGKVFPGYYLTKIDGHDTTRLSYVEVMLMLKARANKDKILEFASCLSKAEVKRLVMANAFEKSSLKVATQKAKKQLLEEARRKRLRSKRKIKQAERLKELKNWTVTLKKGQWLDDVIMTTQSTGFGVQIESYKALGGPLHQQGIEVDSKLIKINGFNVSKLRYCQVMMLLWRNRLKKSQTLEFSTRIDSAALMLFMQDPTLRMINKLLRPLPRRICDDLYDKAAKAYLVQKNEILHANTIAPDTKRALDTKKEEVRKEMAKKNEEYGDEYDDYYEDEETKA
eukprot:g4681.t1